MRDLMAIVLLLTPALAQEQELNIEKYEFIWEAYHAQDVEISVICSLPRPTSRSG